MNLTYLLTVLVQMVLFDQLVHVIVLCHLFNVHIYELLGS